MKNPFDAIVIGDYLEPENEWTAKNKSGSYTTGARPFARYCGENAVCYTWNTPYEKVKCKEHESFELVPKASLHAGVWKLWYDIGLHPRWPIISALEDNWPTESQLPLYYLRRWGNNPTVIPFLKKYPDDPKAFASAVYKWYKAERERVSFRVRDRTIRITRDLRDEFKAHDHYTVEEFLAIENQEIRQAVIQTEKISIKDVIGSMRLFANDDEGRLYADGRQRYLYVEDSTNGEPYLLGVPASVCACGEPSSVESVREGVEGWWMGHKCTFTNLNTPSKARRWTCNLPLDAEFALET